MIFLVLVEKCDFSILAGKHEFSVSAENVISWFWQKMSFLVLTEKLDFSVLVENVIFWFGGWGWGEHDFSVLPKMLFFFVLAGKRNFLFWQKNIIL